jgi:hypothetical protein
MFVDIGLLLDVLRWSASRSIGCVNRIHTLVAGAAMWALSPR